MNDSLLLTYLSLALGVASLFMQYAFKTVPWYLSYGGISCAVGIATFGLLIFLFPPSPSSNEPNPVQDRDRSSLPTNAALTSTRRLASNKESDFPLKFDDHLGHSYLSPQDRMIYTQAIEITATNLSEREIRLEDAYIVSGQTGQMIPLKVAIAGVGLILPSEANPIPPNGPLTLRAEFNAPAGIAAPDFFNTWKMIHLFVKYNGGVQRKFIAEDAVAALYSSFRPSPIGPQTTKRQDQ